MPIEFDIQTANETRWYRHMDVSNLQKFAKRIAPELEGQIAFFVREPDWPFPSGCDAIYAFDSPPWARKKSATHACIIFANESAITLEALLHELAHALPVSPYQPVEPQPISGDADLYRSAWEMGPGSSLIDPKSWDGHDDKFIRRLIPFTYRARNLGIPVDIPKTFNAENYGLRPIEDYHLALASEPAACRGMMFVEIERIQPPQQFDLIFGEDTEARNSEEHVQAKIALWLEKIREIDLRVIDLRSRYQCLLQPIRDHTLVCTDSRERQENLRMISEADNRLHLELQEAAFEKRHYESEIGKLQ